MVRVRIRDSRSAHVQRAGMNTLARPWQLAGAFLVAGLSLGLARSLAEEVPRNPNVITSLTVEAAEVLAQRKAVRRLGGLTTLSAEAAKALA